MGRENGEKSLAGRITLGVSGFVMMAISTPCVLAMLNDLLFLQTDNTTGALIVGSFCAFCAAGGFMMMLASLIRRRRNFRLSRDEEAEILKVAHQLQGRINITELALRSSLSIDESQKALDLLVKRGLAETWPTNDGRLAYIFPEFANKDDRFTAKDPLAFSGEHATLPELRDAPEEEDAEMSAAPHTHKS